MLSAPQSFQDQWKKNHRTSEKEGTSANSSSTLWFYRLRNQDSGLSSHLSPAIWPMANHTSCCGFQVLVLSLFCPSALEEMTFPSREMETWVDTFWVDGGGWLRSLLSLLGPLGFAYCWHPWTPSHQGNCGCVHAKSLWLCLTLCDPTDCNSLGSSVRGILQARILEWVAMPSSRECSWPRDQTQVSCSSWITDRFFTAEPPGKPRVNCMCI